MSRENTEFDVKITAYECTNSRTIRIKFWNDCEQMFEDERLLPVIKKTRIYFKPGDKIKESIKLSGNGDRKDTLQITRDFKAYKKFEGLYDLKNDPDTDEYYIDLNEKLGESVSKENSARGQKQLNPNHGEHEKRDVSGLVTLKSKAFAVINKEDSRKLTETRNINDKTFMFGLVNLLKEQCRDNISALYTINVLEEAIERRIK